MVVIPAIVRGCLSNLGSRGGQLAFLILIIILGIPAIFGGVNLMVGGSRHRTMVKASPPGLAMEQRSVRRTRIKVARFPRFGERFSLKTFCSGFGRAWAERRTSVTSARQADAGVEAVSLWVHLDPASRRPAPLTLEEIDIYGEAAAGRKVTARLRHQSPDGTGEARRWTFRAT